MGPAKELMVVQKVELLKSPKSVPSLHGEEKWAKLKNLGGAYGIP